MMEREGLQSQRKELTLRLDFDFWAKVHELRIKCGYRSINDLIIDLLKEKMEKECK